MLVLTRKRGQRIRVGEEIEVIVLEIHGDRVRLGFEAPASVPIHREEVFLNISNEQGGKLPKATTPLS